MQNGVIHSRKTNLKIRLRNGGFLGPFYKGGSSGWDLPEAWEEEGEVLGDAWEESSPRCVEGGGKFSQMRGRRREVLPDAWEESSPRYAGGGEVSQMSGRRSEVLPDTWGGGDHVEATLGVQCTWETTTPSHTPSPRV